MYITVRERKKSNGDITYDFYISESQREDGKVKSSQKYFFTAAKEDIVRFRTYILKSDKIKALREIGDRAIRKEILEKLKSKLLIMEMNIREAKNRQKVIKRDVNSNLAYDIIKAGYKALAKKLHPDAGGSDEDMKLLNHTYDKLKSLFD